MDVMKRREETLKPVSSPVKSALRVVEILEYFSQRRRGATVTDISSALDYPQSSTSMLLNSLRTMGYLKLDETTRRYLPTWRVMLLGLWLHDGLFTEGSLIRSMKVLSLKTRAGVMIGLRQGIHIRFILSLPSGNAGAPAYPSGVVRPICLSAAGKALLASESDREIVRIAQAANAQGTEAERVDVARLVQEIRQCRKRGWTESLDYPRQGWANIAMPLPEISGQPLMAVTLGMRKASLESRREMLIETLHGALEPLRRM